MLKYVTQKKKREREIFTDMLIYYSCAILWILKYLYKGSIKCIKMIFLIISDMYYKNNIKNKDPIKISKIEKLRVDFSIKII